MMGQKFTENSKVLAVTIRDELWDMAVDQYGYVTARDARGLGVPVVELGKLSARGTLERVSQGLYRFPEWPVSGNDHLMEAVLWTRDPRAALSHETALAVHELAHVNPDKTHVTIPKQRKLRRQDTPPALAVHYQDLTDDQIGWWEQIPCVTIATAIDQCIATRVRPDLMLQAIDRARREGRIDAATADRQRRDLKGTPR
jgi:predicted transcriptional regulator of viral defense system